MFQPTRVRGRVLLTAALLAATAISTAFAQSVAKVPREQTLTLGWSITSPIGVTSPWALPGYTHQEGNNLMWEPLAGRQHGIHQ